MNEKDSFKKLAHIISQYLRLPLSDDSIPGAFMEGVLAFIHKAERLNTYDFVDVVDRKQGIGWQVKSTKATTPVTWKRAKIPNAENLIKGSNLNSAGLQKLGDSIINFCNEHAIESINHYGLSEIRYSRLITFDDGRIKYLERKLCDKKNPIIFDPSMYKWKWSIPKITKGKEQLPALHGTDIRTGKKAWAWHGLGENQLHFSGESLWWEDGVTNSIEFKYPKPEDRLGLEELIALLDKL
jgi:hypothetical protein